MRDSGTRRLYIAWPLFELYDLTTMSIFPLELVSRRFYRKLAVGDGAQAEAATRGRSQ